MTVSQLKTRQRWSVSDYQEALIALKSARVEQGLREYRIFKGLTAKNGFDVNRPEKLTRRKRETIKKLLADLAVIRSRRMVYLNPRNSKRRYHAKKQSGFRSPFFNVIPLPVVPALPVKVSWVENRPVIEYPTIGVKSLIVPIEKGPVYREMKQAAQMGDDPGDAVLPALQKQVRRAGRLIRKIGKPDDLVRYRMRTIYGDIQPGNIYGIHSIEDDLAEDLGRWLNEYRPADEQGNFLIGFTVWLVKREERIPESFKPEFKRVEKGQGSAKKKRKARRSKRTRITGR